MGNTRSKVSRIDRTNAKKALPKKDPIVLSMLEKQIVVAPFQRLHTGRIPLKPEVFLHQGMDDQSQNDSENHKE